MSAFQAAGFQNLFIVFFEAAASTVERAAYCFAHSGIANRFSESFDPST